MTPDKYARGLLSELGYDKPQLALSDSREEAILWAESGAQYLTGQPDGPALPSPAPLATAARGTWLALAALGEGALDPGFPAHQLLGERAAILGLQRRGTVSPGGACHLLTCTDGLIALNLPRADDWHLLPAWLECDADNLDAVTRILHKRPSGPLESRARLLGLAAAVSRSPGRNEPWYQSTRLSESTRQPNRSPLVLDLSTIWAGPLCAALLADMGARVIKVESAARPDGARGGTKTFFDLLNGNKKSISLDLETERGRDQLRHLLQCADIVVESARPRGLEQMGIQATDIVREGEGTTWLSITGYGRSAPLGQWVSYGDDAGVAAGLTALLQEANGTAVFCGDAIADPLTGLHAALLAWHAWTQGGGELLDVPLVGVLTRCINSGNTGHTDGAAVPTPRQPIARSAVRQAPALGADTGAVLSEFGIQP